MANIEKYSAGALAKTKKANEMIDAINSLLNMEFLTVQSNEEPIVEYSDNNVVLRIPEPTTLEYDEETLDVVLSDNTAGTRIFLTKTS
jgi:hypothetical protein